jgi:hypothetical protein
LPTATSRSTVKQQQLSTVSRMSTKNATSHEHPSKRVSLSSDQARTSNQFFFSADRESNNPLVLEYYYYSYVLAGGPGGPLGPLAAAARGPRPTGISLALCPRSVCFRRPTLRTHAKRPSWPTTPAASPILFFQSRFPIFLPSQTKAS